MVPFRMAVEIWSKDNMKQMSKNIFGENMIWSYPWLNGVFDKKTLNKSEFFGNLFFEYCVHVFAYFHTSETNGGCQHCKGKGLDCLVN